MQAECSNAKRMGKQPMYHPNMKGEPPKQKRHTVPRLDISLAEVDRISDSCVPAPTPLIFKPGDYIDGHLAIDTSHLPSPVEVRYLRMVLLGDAYIHGNTPCQPLNRGMFDYRKHTRILSTGIRITRRLDASRSSTDTHSNTAQEMPPWNSQRTHASRQRCWKMKTEDADPHHHPEHPDVQGRNAIIEQLIRRLGTKYAEATETAQRSQLVEGIARDEKCFMLDPDLLHRIRFSIPVPTKRPLPGTSQHLYFPVRYQLLALFVYTTGATEQAQANMTYTTIPIQMLPTPPTFNAASQTKPSYFWLTENRVNRLLLSFQRYIGPKRSDSQQELLVSTPSRKVSGIGKRLLRHLTHYCVQRRHALDVPYLSSMLLLSQQTLSRGQAIPLLVKLETKGIHIKQILLDIKLKRNVYMTYNLGECALTETVLHTSTVVGADDVCEWTPQRSSLYDSDRDTLTEQSWALDSKDNVQNKENTHLPPLDAFGQFTIDLSHLIQIPNDCCYSVTAEMTRGMLALDYEVRVKIRIAGHKRISSELPEIAGLFCPTTLQPFGATESFLLKPDPLVITIA